MRSLAAKGVAVPVTCCPGLTNKWAVFILTRARKSIKNAVLSLREPSLAWFLPLILDSLLTVKAVLTAGAPPQMTLPVTVPHSRGHRVAASAATRGRGGAEEAAERLAVLSCLSPTALTAPDGCAACPVSTTLRVFLSFCPGKSSERDPAAVTPVAKSITGCPVWCREQMRR